MQLIPSDLSYRTWLEGGVAQAADREHRSVANMVEVLIRDYCGRSEITIQKQRALLLEDERKPQSPER